jgi:Fe-S-cluster containining protein
MLQEQTMRKLLNRSKLFPNAHDKNEKECIKCGFCCWQRPCYLDKEDVKNIANFLNITEEDLFETYLCVDEIKNKLILLPIRHQQKNWAGEYLPSERTFDCDTPCIFNDEKTNLCKIHEVKPVGGRSMFCNDPKITTACLIEWNKKDLEELGWDGSKYNEDNN